MPSSSLLAALPPSLSTSTSKVGRPAKMGERYPSGKLKANGPAPAQIRRVIDMARHKALDTMLATAVGWLRLHNLVTDTDVSAAMSYAKQKSAYDAVMGTPRRTARSPAYEIGLGNSPGLETKEQAEAAAKIRKRYAAMLNALASAKQRELLDRVCVDDEHPSAWEMVDLLDALSRVARHLRLTR